jgi:hypothetical protein
MTVWVDPIVEEVRKVRDALAARFNYDLNALFDHLKELERTSGRKYVSYPPKRLRAEPRPAARPKEGAA